MDHNVPTVNRYDITDMIARKQMDTLRKTVKNLEWKLLNLEVLKTA